MARRWLKPFLEEGARVAVNGRNSETAQLFRSEFEGKAARADVTDITDYEGMEAVAQSVVEEWGRIDILINNAGIAGPLGQGGEDKKGGF